MEKGPPAVVAIVCRVAFSLVVVFGITVRCCHTHLPLLDRLQYTADRPELDGLYKKYGGLERNVMMIPFRGTDRLKIIHSILVAKRADTGCNLDVLRLVKSKCLLAFFPLHDKVELRALQRK